MRPASGSTRRPLRRGLLWVLLSTVVLAMALVALPARATPAPGGTPGSDAAAAQASARSAAARTASLRTQERRLSAQVTELSHAAAAAGLRSDRAASAEQRAAVLTAAAARRASQLRRAYGQARLAWVQLVAQRYETGGSTPLATAGNLLLAPNPGTFLATQELGSLVQQYRAGVAAHADAAARASAQASAALALDAATLQDAAATARTARAEADAALRRATRTLTRLRQQLAQAQTDQAQVDAVMSRFLGGWSMADPARSAELDEQYLRLARAHRADPPAPAGGGWTAAEGQSVVWRSLMWIGTPYAWAGGSSSGPTTGVCAGGGASQDCHIVGFDCSGLSMYGWAPYRSLPHLAAEQYDSGAVHPEATALLPGDLVFWSTDGTVAGIHHVAIYVGGGNVLQAPYSGALVQITPLGSVDSGYFGATRPGS